jgi:hypothetical protein
MNHYPHHKTVAFKKGKVLEESRKMRQTNYIIGDYPQHFGTSYTAEFPKIEGY